MTSAKDVAHSCVRTTGDHDPAESTSAGSSILMRLKPKWLGKRSTLSRRHITSLGKSWYAGRGARFESGPAAFLTKGMNIEQRNQARFSCAGKDTMTEEQGIVGAGESSHGFAGSASEFRNEIEHAINRASMENGSNTPDFILANYLQNCLSAFDIAVKQRDNWYGIEPRPGWSGPNNRRTFDAPTKEPR